MFYRNGNVEFEITGGSLPSEGILFVDHSKEGRSGHLGHAMVETAEGEILCFYPNCSGSVLKGHNGNGWMEIKRSRDGGETWSDPEPFPYSKQLYDLNIGVTAMCEKAVLCPNGEIVAFNLICEIHNNVGWEPFGLPTYVKSRDGGKTWSQAYRFGQHPGRIYDACVKDGRIYALIAVGAIAGGADAEYHLFISDDNGETFSDYSTLPFFTRRESRVYYGTMGWLEDGGLIVYVYRDNKDEKHPEYAVSADGGKTWSAVQTAYFAKRIRNMQMVKLENTYFILGRSGTNAPEAENGHNVLYCSADGIHWDEGQYLRMREHGIGAYSNTLLVHSRDASKPTRLLYQASYAYDNCKCNVLHWWIDAKKI
jgi:hypothetical protein